MKRIMLIGVLAFTIISCGEKEQTLDKEVLTVEDQTSLEEAGTQDIEKIEFKGDYKGEYKGKPLELKLKNKTFKVQYGNASSSGEVYLIGDGSVIELDSKKGKSPIRFVGWSDENTLLILNDDGTFPEEEILLQK